MSPKLAMSPKLPLSPKLSGSLKKYHISDKLQNIHTQVSVKNAD